MIVIGLVGEKGGGKGKVAEILKTLQTPKLPVTHLRSSDLLLEIAGLVGICPKKVSRAQLIRLAVDLVKNFGEGCISEGMRRKINRHDGIVIFDGIRLPTDAPMIRNFSPNLLIYVTADTIVRFERVRKRKEKAGEGSMTYEQFLVEENLETERHIPEIGKTADIRINNNGTYHDLRSRVIQIFHENIKHASD